MESTDLRELLTVRPLSEWHEGHGAVLWWRYPIDEPPYVGGPNDLGYPIEIHTVPEEPKRFTVYGWPGYHTHWSPIPKVFTPKSAAT